MLNQYSGFIFFLPYDMMGVVMAPLRFSGLPILSRKYSGGASHGCAGLGINSVGGHTKRDTAQDEKYKEINQLRPPNHFWMYKRI